MRNIFAFMVLVFSVSVVPSITYAGIDDGLVLHLNFDEISGNVVDDSSGNGNDGTLNNIEEEDIVAGKIGQAVTLNGTNSHSGSYIQVADDDSLDGFSAFSMCGWGYLNDYNPLASNFISKSATPYNTDYQSPYAMHEIYVSSSGVVNMGVSIGGAFQAFDGGSPIPLDTWTHICGIYDGSEMKLYVDGQDVSARPTTGVVDSNSQDLLIGSYGASNSFNTWDGLLDDMRIYDRALSKYEIQELFDLPNVDTTAPEITLLGDATINLTVGDSYNDAGATASDNVDGDITSSIVVTGLPINTSAAGNFTVRYNVSDAAHNDAVEITRTVNVSSVVIPPDTTAPVITRLGDAVVNLTVGDSYTDAGATASDNTDGDITANIVVTGLPINTSASGSFTIRYNVSDAAHNPAVEVTRIVNVSSVVIPPDTTAPVITLNGSSSVGLEVGDTYTEQGATATDNIDVSVIIVTGGDVVNTNTAGTYIVTYNATDTAGNHAIQVTRTVIVSAHPIDPPSEESEEKNNSRVVGGNMQVRTSNPLVAPRISVTPATGQVLGASSFHFTQVLVLGSEGNEVLELQKFLKKSGYYAGNVDGKYGWETMQAVIGLQIINKMVKTDGIVGKETRAFLNK